MRILVCGGDNFNDHQVLNKTLDRLRQEHEVSLLIAGGVRGADRLAEEWAKAGGVACHRVPWRLGTIRNQQMFDEGRPELVVAFPGGVGTADMVRRARNAGIEVIEVMRSWAPVSEGGLSQTRSTSNKRW